MAVTDTQSNQIAKELAIAAIAKEKVFLPTLSNGVLDAAAAGAAIGKLYQEILRHVVGNVESARQK